MVASFEQKMPSKVFKHISWGWPADYVVRCIEKLRPMSDTQQSGYRATLLFNNAAYRQLSFFHRQTIAKQTWLLVTQMTT